MNYTETQRRAIETQGDAVLVSAAAGSGKTSVLARRVARLIEDGADIRSMLVMTFTKAAAAEMKTRIARELARAAAERKDARLLEQSELAGAADICTFHSFCAKAVRENYAVTGAAPDFRIMPEEEAVALRAAVLRDYFDLLYERQDADFLRLLRRYTTRADDGQLMRVLLRVMGGMMGQPDPFGWALRSANMEPRMYAAILKREYEALLLSMLEEAVSLMRLALSVAEEYNAAQAAADAETVEKLSDMLCCARGASIGEAMEYFAELKIPNLLRGADPAVKELSGEWRSEARSLLKRFLEDEVYANFEETVLAQLAHTTPDVRAMVELIRVFSRMYDAEKKRSNALDYEDLQHRALKALRECGAVYKERFSHIFVDEYQDTNPVQEEIISLVTGDNKLFMVGDVKQSIYRFRLADPGIFRRKASLFRSAEQNGEIIVMNDNFRSCGGVIDAVNFVMECVMSERLGEVEYHAEERLSKNKEGGCARILLCGVEEMPDAEEEGEDTSPASWDSAQADMIAARIAADVAASGTDASLSYGDFAILMRSRSNLTAEIKRALDARGIPCVISMKQTRDIPEVELFVNLLRLVDNPLRDVPLLSVLRSFIGGMDERDFAVIREKYAQGNFCEAALRFTQEESGGLAARLKKFFEEMDALRLECGALPLMDFVNGLAERYGFFRYVSCAAGGAAKRGIFEEFLALTATLTEAGGNSLYGLLRELDEIKKRQGGYVQYADGSRSADCVKIMTIHGSKGLEFPVVFIAGMNKKFNLRDMHESFLLHSEYGVSTVFVDEEKRERFDTVERTVLREKLACENRSEELRMLYVAMTRAKERLYMTGCIKDAEKQMRRFEALSGRYDSANCMLDWVMAANMARRGIEVELVQPEGAAAQNTEFDFDAWRAKMTEMDGAAELISLPVAARVPAKVSVSAVKRSAQPGIRSFLRPQHDDAEGEITGAELGTLVHSLMERMVKSGAGVEAEANAMLEAELVTAAEHSALLENRQMAERFLQTKLYERIRAAERVLYEQHFNMRVGASEIGYGEKGEMLVQGIIDLAFMENGKWVLVDYKTDRVGADGVEKAAEGYKVQLELYSKALERITGIGVAERALYFMRPGVEFLC